MNNVTVDDLFVVPVFFSRAGCVRYGARKAMQARPLLCLIRGRRDTGGGAKGTPKEVLLFVTRVER